MTRDLLAVVEGVEKWVREYDAAQKLTGDERRRAEGNAAAKLRGWVMREWPDDMTRAASGQTGVFAGHGHVFPRADGAKARCGGPGICPECSRDQSHATRKETPP